MAETDIFHCEPRARTGTGGARATRRAGFIPGVLYGGGEAPAAIQLKERELQKAYKAGRLRSHLAKIDVPGEDGQQPVIPRDVQIHPVKGNVIHVDLMRVNEKTRIDVEVPVRFINEEESPGLKKGGVLNTVRHAIHVYAPAMSIPEVFEIDVTGLEVGDAIHVSTISLPKDVTLVITDRDYTVATIAAPSAMRSADDDDAEDSDAEDGDAEDTEATETEATEGKGEAKKED